jgi:hypothetical protein
MITNADEIVSQFKQNCDELLHSVRHATPGTTAYAAEAHIFKEIIKIGALALGAFLAAQAELYHLSTATDSHGRVLDYKDERKGLLYSIFGTIRFFRSYYDSDGHGWFAMDAALNLPPKGQSDFLRKMTEDLAVDTSYRDATTKLAKYFPISISTRALQEEISIDSEDVQAFYAEAPAPPPSVEATILVAEADGKAIAMVKSSLTDKDNAPVGLEHPAEAPAQTGSATAHLPGLSKGEPKREGKKKDVTVVSISRHIPFKRTPEQVRESLFRDRIPEKDKDADRSVYSDPREKPNFKRTWASINGKVQALAQAVIWAMQACTEYITDFVSLTDGQDGLQRRVDEMFPGYKRVLDLIHAIGYLWKAADAKFGKSDQAGVNWVYDNVLLMLQGKTAAIITELVQWADQMKDSAICKPIKTSAFYFERNLDAMRYDEYLAKGWPIATGIIEGACRHVVKDRCERSGMRWTMEGVEALLHLRCVYQNGDWDAYHLFRMKQRHERVYGVKAKQNAEMLETDVYKFNVQRLYAEAA